MSGADYEYPLDPKATNNTAAAIVAMALTGGERLLDLGSGPGIVASHLQREHGRSVTCLDADKDLLAVATGRGVEDTILANLDDPDWPDLLEGRRFDVIILADVLEHLAAPEAVLDAIAGRGLLADGGFLVVSIPNAAHQAVIAELLTGHFTYHPTGLLDRTHIRFFTRDSFTELAEQHGFAVTEVRRTLRTLEQTEFRDRISQLDPEVYRILSGRGVEGQTYQLIMRLTPLADERAVAMGMRVAELGQRAEELDRHVAELTTRNTELTARNTELETLLDDLRAAMAEAQVAADSQRIEAVAAAQQLTENLKADLLRAERGTSQAEREAAKLSTDLEAIHDSFTWKAGRVVKRMVDPAIGARNAMLHRRRQPRRAKSPRPRRPGAAQDDDAVPPGPAADLGSLATPFTIAEHPLRSLYRQEVGRSTFDGSDGSDGFASGGRKVAFTVYTSDLDKGRGDVYVAAGIGLRLRRAGTDIAYLPTASWYDLPEGTDTVVAMLPALRPSRIPPEVRCVAWIRNEVDTWLAHPELSLFDGILTSSQQSLDAVTRIFHGPAGILRIGVDLDLFAPAEETDRHGVVGTVNQWGRERDVYRALRAQPVTFPLALYGHDSGLHPTLAGYAAGPVSYFSLPGLYRQAMVTLDDFNHTTVKWGNVNSRLYEALAAGSVVVTNTSRGLDEIGLGQVPTFTTGAELHTVIDRLLADPEGTTALAQRLQATVRREHGFAARAGELLAFLDRVDRERRTGHRVLAFYPGDYRFGNPYQDMLYGGLGEIDVVALPTGDPFQPAQFDGYARADGARVFHVHWTAPILGPARTEDEAVAARQRMLDGIDAFRAGGGRLVWTVHNVLPHECAYPEVEAGLRQGLADRADAVHVMCPGTAAAVAEHFTLPADRTFVIPHASFVGIYGDAMDRATARTVLGVGADDIVLLTLGGIRPYKALDRLLDAFDAALRAEPRLRLVVAGKPGRFPGVVELERRLQLHPRVVAQFASVPEEDLQLFFKACDVAVLPHRTALNSGGLLLAYTFGRPVIAPEVGCLVDALDPAASIGFDPGDDTSLMQALANAGSLLGPEHGLAARAAADRYTPPDMARDFAASLDRLLG
ncbi:MAG: methyltransferase domain-containing protein [Actinomycetota bacterium]|nr:methyltransferase domain-containing protein [Actinomycetota bacterium]